MLLLFEDFKDTNQGDMAYYVSTTIDSYGDYICKYMNALPTWVKDKIFDYTDNGRYIDVDMLNRLNRKYNIASKVKYLYNKGYRNIKDFISNILPNKNESALAIIGGIIILIVSLLLSIPLGMFSAELETIRARIISLIIASIILTGGFWASSKLFSRELNHSVVKVHIVIKEYNKSDTLISVIKDKDGNIHVSNSNSD